MNLKNEMLNTESSNTTFNQTQQSNSQWTPSHLTQTILPSNDTFSNLAIQQANSNYTFSNPNLTNLNQDVHSTANNLQQQLNDQFKAFANSQFTSHYYNHHHHHHPFHSQPTILNNSLVHNNVYEFTNELSTSNGQKAYFTNVTNDIHQYNISLHHSNASTTDSSSLNFHHHHHPRQLENCLEESNQNSFLNSSTATTVLPLTKKRKKLEQTCLTSLNSKSSNQTELKSKSLTTFKNVIKKDPDQHLISNPTKDEEKQTNLNLSLNQAQIDTASYPCKYYFTNTSSELSEQINQNNYSSDSVFKSIDFKKFQETAWHVIYDDNFKKLPTPELQVYADKGFNYSHTDDVFICQKKNHFQISYCVGPIKFNDFISNEKKKRRIFIELRNENEEYEFKEVQSFFLNFYGIKFESPNQTIKIEQSQSDRSKKPFNPIPVEENRFLNGQEDKKTIGRLHFAETTSGNMRKKGRPNPDQKYFKLVAALVAMVDDKYYNLISYASDRIIVRASNPGQFENDTESCWMKSQYTNDAIYHNGRVGINIDDPEESLSINGNLKLTGVILQPSDRRIKENIKQLDTCSSLANLSKINLYSFNYTESYGLNCLGDDRCKEEIGVLAQELIEILPNAVKNCGSFKLNQSEVIEDFLVVQKDVLFFQGIGAIKELIRITSNLNSKLDEQSKNHDQLNRITLDLEKRLERLEYEEQLRMKSMYETRLLNSTNLRSFVYLIIFLFLFMLMITGFSELIKLS